MRGDPDTSSADRVAQSGMPLMPEQIVQGAMLHACEACVWPDEMLHDPLLFFCCVLLLTLLFCLKGHIHDCSKPMRTVATRYTAATSARLRSNAAMACALPTAAAACGANIWSMRMTLPWRPLACSDCSTPTCSCTAVTGVWNGRGCSASQSTSFQQCSQKRPCGVPTCQRQPQLMGCIQAMCPASHPNAWESYAPSSTTAGHQPSRQPNKARRTVPNLSG